MSDGVWHCEACGYTVGRSWGAVMWTCPRCKGDSDFVEKVLVQKSRIESENRRLKKKIRELENKINPPFLGEGI